MVDNKINFGKFVLSVDQKQGFANAYFEGRKPPTSDLDQLCLLIDKELSISHYRQSKNGIEGEGKRVWGKLSEANVNTLVMLGGQYSENYVPAEILPEEVLCPVDYLEESTTLVSINAYERSPEDRKICIEHHGNNCSICDFSFGEAYGVIGSGYIQVHHLKPLPKIGHEYLLDPVEDLRPVCANCHSMLHRRSPALSIEDLMNLMRREIDTELTESQKFYVDFWPELLNEIKLDDPLQPFPTSSGKTGNIFFPMPPSGGQCWITVYFVQQKKHVGVFLTFMRGDYANHVYNTLLDEKDIINVELGIDAIWESKDGKHSICSYKTYDNPKDDKYREEIKLFLNDTINRYVNVFRSRLSQIAGEI